MTAFLLCVAGSAQVRHQSTTHLGDSQRVHVSLYLLTVSGGRVAHRSAFAGDDDEWRIVRSVAQELSSIRQRQRSHRARRVLYMAKVECNQEQAMYSDVYRGPMWVSLHAFTKARFQISGTDLL